MPLSLVKIDITNQMIDAVEARAAIINGHVTSAEEYMSAFALSSKVRELLLNPEDPVLLKKAQKYTEDFASVKGIFEGLYIATPATHTFQNAIGMTTRKGESLNTFQNTILSQQKLTNLGIMKSPGTGSMILSMYYPIFEGQKCIGFVGAGVYASHLMDALLNLNIEGLPDSEYVFLNAETGVYKYLKDRNWVFIIRDSATEVYGAMTTIHIVVGILCAVVAAAIILITLLILYREGKELMTVEHAISRLGDLNLSADRELEIFYNRSDEIGMIAQTTHRVCGCLRKTIDDVGRILGEIANGNLTVDVTKNESYYIGDFQVLSNSLKSIHANLMNVIRDISLVANQVDTSADRVSTGALALSQGTIAQATSIDGLVSHVTTIASQIENSTARCSSASEMVDKAAGYASETDTKMKQLMTATKNIEQSSTQIITIIMKILLFKQIFWH